MIDTTIVDIQSRAQSALSDNPVQALRNVHVDRDGQQLLLSGRVKTFYHKQLAQEVVRNVAQGLRVVNSIVVD